MTSPSEQSASVVGLEPARVVAGPTRVTGDVLAVLQRYWGYDTLRPLQDAAIAAGLAKRDSLVVMPTGGGKSLCYQVPAALANGLSVVVSPLISLMKDQVDGLRLSGYPAGALHSGVSPEEASEVRAQVASGELKLLYVSPERLVGAGFLSWLARLYDAGKLASFAIDEAHCISQWGHDFRPEYRQLQTVRETLPGVAFHAFTATATPRVREDICQQLALRNPTVLVGRFDRPNLTYRIVERAYDPLKQAADVLRRHDGRAAIIYCISRKETEQYAAELTGMGIRAKAYHAGLNPDKRAKVQNEFLEERLNVVVATVAFGMGIDRGDVRCVIHMGMPKTVEAYQQETGRAGRDGLASECVMIYGTSDASRWLRLMERGAEESDAEPAQIAHGLRVQKELLQHMQNLCGSARCRHAALSEYFGQQYEQPEELKERGVVGCGACDICMGELAPVADSTTIAKKILSCVYRVGQRYGAAYVRDVLTGSMAKTIVERGHDKLSTHGLLKEMPKERVMACIQQLIDTGYLGVEMITTAAGGTGAILQLVPASNAVLKGERDVTLYEPKRERGATRQAAPSVAQFAPSLNAEETKLFESLRELRRAIAEKKGVPPYVVFSDVTLEELARVRPGSEEKLLGVRGIGQIKLREFGGAFIDHIALYCKTHGLQLDAAEGSRPRSAKGQDRARDNAAQIEPKPKKLRHDAAAIFMQGIPLARAAERLALSASATCDHLCLWIEQTKPASVEPWVDDATYKRVETALDEVGGSRLRPIWEHLEGKVSYEEIKVVIAHLRSGA
ncbi:MAG: DNA helicase RecQ [Phycisphaerae bacterium]